MHSFLIISKNKKTSLGYSLVECKKNQIDKFDIDILTFEKAIGIEDVRSLQKKIFLKPIKSKTKAIILDSYSGLTISAQNALLKLLEEPPFNTIIYIISSNKELFLPTILSRCKIVELKDKFSEPSKEELARYLNILISLPSSSVGQKLKLAQDIAKNKDQVIPEIEKMIVVARKNLIDRICHSRVRLCLTIKSLARDPIATLHDDNTTATQYLNILISLSKTYTIISTTNANQRLVLENLFLNL